MITDLTDFLKTALDKREKWTTSVFTETLIVSSELERDWRLDWDEDAGESVATITGLDGVIMLLFRPMPFAVFHKAHPELRHLLEEYGIRCAEFKSYTSKNFIADISLFAVFERTVDELTKEGAFSAEDLYYFLV